MPHITKSLRKQLRYTFSVIGFLLPTMVGLILFQYIPIGVAIRNSLFRMSLLNPKAAEFIGFSNYVNIITDEIFWKSVINTLLYAGGKLFIQIPFALLLAIILNQKLIRAWPLSAVQFLLLWLHQERSLRSFGT